MFLEYYHVCNCVHGDKLKLDASISSYILRTYLLFSKYCEYPSIIIIFLFFCISMTQTKILQFQQLFRQQNLEAVYITFALPLAIWARPPAYSVNPESQTQCFISTLYYLQTSLSSGSSLPLRHPFFKAVTFKRTPDSSPP